MRILFIDDMDSRHKVFRERSIGCVLHQAFDADQAIEFLKKNDYDLIFFDHDLEDEHYETLSEDHKNGTYIAKKMVKKDKHKNAIVFVHSLNPDGRKNIIAVLKDYCTVYDAPGCWTSFAIVDGAVTFATAVTKMSA